MTEVEYGATMPEYALRYPTGGGAYARQVPAVPEPPPGPGWEFLSAVALEGRVVWYWKRTGGSK